MTGNFEHKIDTKGRLFIPASLREELGETFYVTISDEPCLNVFSSDGWNNLMEQINQRPMREKRKMRPFFSNAARCELDLQGRFLLPQKLRDRISLKKDVTIVGIGTMVQFWDSDTFAELNSVEASSENLADVMDELDF